MEVIDSIASARYLLRNLKIMGLWQWGRPESGSSTGKPPLFIIVLQTIHRYLLHIPLTSTYITLMAIEIVLSKSMDQAADIVYIGLTETALAMKVLSIWYQGDKAWDLVHNFATNKDYALRTPAERKFWKREMKIFWFVMNGFQLSSLNIVFLACVGVLFVDDYVLPFAFWVPFEWRNPQNYWYPYVYSWFAMTFTCYGNTNIDGIVCYCMFHISMLYRLLGKRLEALKHLKDEDVAKELQDLLKLDQNIRRLTRQCESIVSVPILSQIILSAIILCFSGYRLTKMDTSNGVGPLIAMLQYVVAMILQIFLPCYYANEVTVAANTLTTSVYSADWVHFSPETRKMLYIYMESLKRQVIIKSGSFFLVGLPIFTKTMNNAYSILAVLLNMERKQ